MDYTNISPYYDVIMTSGYYDYKKIVDHLIKHYSRDYFSFEKVIEIGCGTGLILEELAKRKLHHSIVGIDLTESMLTIAQERLQQFPDVTLSLQNVLHLNLQEKFTLAFSYGGVWYFVIDSDREPFLVSHIVDDADNHQGFEQVAKHILKGGVLLLGVQKPHCDYETVIANGWTYSQTIKPLADGFIKNYYLTNGKETLMKQTTHYRTYSFVETQELLANYGFQYQPIDTKNKLFLEFKKI